MNFKCQVYSNNLKDCRGKIYDNGADMVGKAKGIRPQIWLKTRRVLCTMHGTCFEFVTMRHGLSWANSNDILWNDSKLYMTFSGLAPK